jgi:uncharacterized membrane protein YphA (DoxX/SURF4 family)
MRVDHQGIDDRLVFCLRVVVAAIWLYEGLWLKLLTRAPHELAVVAGVGGRLAPERLLELIGGGESLLALGVLCGLWWRPLAWFQLALLAAMNAIGILAGGGAIADPAGLVIRNLPFVMCIILIGLYGPGAWALGGRSSGGVSRDS